MGNGESRRRARLAGSRSHLWVVSVEKGGFRIRLRLVTERQGSVRRSIDGALSVCGSVSPNGSDEPPPETGCGCPVGPRCVGWLRTVIDADRRDRNHLPSAGSAQDLSWRLLPRAARLFFHPGIQSTRRASLRDRPLRREAATRPSCNLNVHRLLTRPHGRQHRSTAPGSHHARAAAGREFREGARNGREFLPPCGVRILSVKDFIAAQAPADA